MLAYWIKAMPHRTVDTTSSVAVSTTLYVHIFAFDLVRAVRYAVNSVARASSLTQCSEATCICTLNRFGSPGVYGEYNRQKAGTFVVATSVSRILALKDQFKTPSQLCADKFGLLRGVRRLIARAASLYQGLGRCCSASTPEMAAIITDAY